ncbi:hypothetical protein, partial [Thermobifida halotolerans]
MLALVTARITGLDQTSGKQPRLRWEARRGRLPG